MFLRLDELDPEVVNRFADWFAFHLSNFNYSWPWANWAAVVNKATATAAAATSTAAAPTAASGGSDASSVAAASGTSAAPNSQKLFITDVLSRCSRLSYWQNMRDKILPPAMHPFLPDEPKPAFRFAKHLIPAADLQATEKSQTIKCVELAAAMIHNIRKKPEPIDSAGLLRFLDAEVTTKLGASEAVHGRLRLLFPVLLEAGQKSYSHVMSLVERYKEVIKALVAVDPIEAHSIIISSVAEYWQHSHQHIIVLLDKLTTYGLIPGAAVVSWIFANRNRFYQYVTRYTLHVIRYTRAGRRRSPSHSD